MALSVKQLIRELDKIENKYLEVEVDVPGIFYSHEIESVKKGHRKVLIFTKANDDE